ncbi:MAG: uroporphyrinogen decarboxylase family protein [Promethearchaeota archaeon]
MNSRERVLTTFQFKEPDRVPLFEAWIEGVIMDAIGNGDPYETRARLGLDCMPIAVGHPKSTNAWKTGTDEWGRIFKNHWYLGGVVKTLDDIEKYSPPLEYAEEWFPTEMMNESRKIYGDTHALYYAFHDVCFVLSYMSMGMEDFFVAVHRNRELVEALIQRSTDWTIAMIEQANAAEVDFIMIGDDVADSKGPMISIKMFQELVLPRYKEIVSTSEVPLIWHSDGQIEPLLPFIIDAGFAGVHALEPDVGVNMGKIKEQYGNKLVLVGNLDVTNVLTQTDLELVRKDVKRCIKQGAPGGGYLFSSSNSLFESMHIESILEAYRYAKEIGYYSG